MPDQFSSSDKGSVTVFIYKPELDYLKWLVLQKREIETGGDLFGLWQDKNTAVVQFILGPGKGCKRTATSFHQDVDYLSEVGGYLTSSQGLCNIGEWHSHHTLGLAKPSYGDQQTVWNNISSVAGGRFLVFIANIRGTPAKVNIGCFLFKLSEQKMTQGNIKCLPCETPFRRETPFRLTMKNEYIASNAEIGQDWTTFEKRSVKSDSSNEEYELQDEPTANDETEVLIPTESPDEEEMGTCRKFFTGWHRRFTNLSRPRRVAFGIVVTVIAVVVVAAVVAAVVVAL